MIARRAYRGVLVGATVSVLAWGTACAPRVGPLRGIAVERASLPTPVVSQLPQQWRVTWQYADDTFSAQGEGVVRMTPTALARLDLFMANGFGSGMALLDGDSLFVPGIDLIGRFLPPPPLLWGALGRLALPFARDTTVRVDGDTVRADITEASAAPNQSARVWRAHFVGRDLVRLERIERRRVVEWMTRARDAAGAIRLRYVHATGRRSLSLTVDDVLTIPDGFDAAIWRRP